MNTNLTLNKNDIESSVKLSLWFTGDEIPLEKITSILETEPAHSRKKSDWRMQNEFTCDEWVFDLKEINCSDVEELFQKFIGIFAPKTNSIKNICCDYNCKASIILVIHMENCSQPYTILSPDTIAFLHSINAEFVIDIYGYDNKEY
ncbi:MAG: DUF4279 domain-containing protein [Acutalibacteraceae bacterium]|nr:DUF4279 domain-containing protein [Acutalibacteraceae bacterium]